MLTLFGTGQQVSPATIEAHRAAFRDAIARAGLSLVEITPAATADEVLVASAEPAGTPESAIGAHWSLPDDLDLVWSHLGLRADAPREVKKVKLRELMLTPAWRSAPSPLQGQAEEYLDAD
ncbi:hypothetical protein BWI15_17640 [Kribbella sp. ALI-6-A]|nr:hypothetical protein BWI15_17640 [Kribbella sp. ALI-6-A]